MIGRVGTAWLAAALSLAGVSTRAQDAPPEAPERPPVEVVRAWFPESITRMIATPLPGWLPIYLELESSSERTESVRVVARFEPDPQSALRAYVTESVVEVNPGPARRTYVYVRHGDPRDEHFGRRVSVEVLHGETTVFRQTFGLDSVGRDSSYAPLPVFVCGASSGDVALALRQTSRFRAGSSNAFVGNSAGVETDVLEERMLPDDAIGYHAVRCLLLTNVDESELEEAQVRAIREWVALGGRLLLLPGKNGEIFSTRLVQGMLPEGAVGPIAVEDDFLPGPIAFKEQLDAEGFLREPRRGAAQPQLIEWQAKGESAQWRLARIDPIDPTLTASRSSRTIVSVRLDETKRRVEETQRLYYEIGYGKGAIGIFTVDPFGAEGLAGLPFTISLWNLATSGIGVGATSEWVDTTAMFRDESVFAALKKGLSHELGLWFLGVLLLAYLVLIGPAVYLVLKRLNRLPWVVWVQPAIVVIYVAFVFTTGYLMRGVLTRTRLVTVFHVESGEPFLHKASFLGIFSSDDARYHVTAGADRWVRPIFENTQAMADVRVQTRSGEPALRGATLRGMRLDVWQTGVYASSDLLPADGVLGIGYEQVEAGGGADDEISNVVTIRNDTPFTITQGFLLEQPGGARRAFPTGPIAPGGTVRLDERAPRVSLAEEVRKGDEDEVSALELLDGDDLARDVLRRVVEGELGGGRRRGVRFVALLDRRDEDFSVSQSTSLAHRADVLAVHGGP